MSRQRKLIRIAAADALKNNTPVGANVFPSRSAPLWSGFELPGICVYGKHETITLEQEAPRLYKRVLDLRIEVAAQGADTDDKLDDIGDRVERVFGRSDRLTYAKENTCAELTMSDQDIEFRDDGKSKIGVLIMKWDAVYYTSEPDDEDPAPIDDLKKVATDYKIGGDGTERAKDLVELT